MATTEFSTDDETCERHGPKRKDIADHKSQQRLGGTRLKGPFTASDDVATLSSLGIFQQRETSFSCRHHFPGVSNPAAVVECEMNVVVADKTQDYEDRECQSKTTKDGRAQSKLFF